MVAHVAKIETEKASRYLEQLCKHFGHKVPVNFDAAAGQIDLPIGVCRLSACPDTLTMRVEGTEANIERLEQVIGDHLARFAFRENPAIAWQPAT